MAEAEQPQRLRPEHQVTVDDVRQLMGASTPHFALQLRNRIAKLIRDLPDDDPASRLGLTEIARLERLAFTGENRGEQGQDGERPLRSNDPDEPVRRVPGVRSPLRSRSAPDQPRGRRPASVSGTSAGRDGRGRCAAGRRRRAAGRRGRRQPLARAGTAGRPGGRAPRAPGAARRQPQAVIAANGDRRGTSRRVECRRTVGPPG